MNKPNFQDILSAAALTAITLNPKVDYDADAHPEIQRSAEAILTQYGITSNELDGLLVYRDLVEKHLRKRYGVKFTDNPLDNIEQKMKRKRVPQKARVEHGILDMLIGELYVGSMTVA
jgi:hypothetical protein